MENYGFVFYFSSFFHFSHSFHAYSMCNFGLIWFYVEVFKYILNLNFIHIHLDFWIPDPCITIYSTCSVRWSFLHLNYLSNLSKCRNSSSILPWNGIENISRWCFVSHVCVSYCVISYRMVMYKKKPMNKVVYTHFTDI